MDGEYIICKLKALVTISHDHMKVGATSGLAMANFEEPLTTTSMEAMHFRRGLHYLR